MSAAADSQVERDDGASLEALLDELLVVRGVVAAAVVTADGEMVASRSHDRGRLERTVGAITSALAAGQALGELLPAEDGSSETEASAAGGSTSASDGARATSSVILMFEDGPILLTPLANPERVVVLALDAERDLGRARLKLRGLMARLSAAAVPVS